METYLFLNETDKNKIKKLAQSKQLSLSTATDIIYKHYYWLICQKEEYFEKGNKQIHIKIKNENKNPINTMFITNALYAYLHNDVIKTHTKEHLKKINSSIQSEMDKTFDPSCNKNIIIRELYRNRKALTKQC